MLEDRSTLLDQRLDERLLVFGVICDSQDSSEFCPRHAASATATNHLRQRAAHSGLQSQ
jgi:hypothetical protein